MNFWDKMEKKFGRYAIPNLSLYLILCYGCGYLLYAINPAMLNYLTLDPYKILHGQIWRLVTWILIPGDGGSINILTLLMLFFYYSIGSSLERAWGTFYYNAYLFLGMVFTIVESFLIMGISYLLQDAALLAGTTVIKVASETYFAVIAQEFSMYYICMSIFFAFAATFPDSTVYLMFILPIKMKWMGIAYGVLMLVEAISASWIVERIIVLGPLLYFIIFMMITRTGFGMRISPRQVKRRHDYRKEVKKAKPMSVAKHKCAICGRTSDEYPDLEFRFCSKCNGNYEYCQDHLFTHTHVQ